jgi:hypothetical protein
MDAAGETLAGLAGQLASAAGDLAATASGDTEPASAGGGTAEAGGALWAVRLASDAHRLAGAALQASVTQARVAGHTWQDVGELLGVTRQAAFQRFGRGAGPGEGR